uniref:Uncharacterized protein n=1 Tax=Pararge aegeria TaxID=116150 RepID=S4NUM8_9NEOP
MLKAGGSISARGAAELEVVSCNHQVRVRKWLFRTILLVFIYKTLNSSALISVLNKKCFMLPKKPRYSVIIGSS